MTLENFRAFRIHQDEQGHHAGIETMQREALSPGDVVIQVKWSSVNYKDALAGMGRGKILRRYPLVGGIDLAGTVLTSSDTRFLPGDPVLCTGSGLSETRDGGYSGLARIPAASLIPLPEGLDLREAMILGTAGFTAGLALLRMQDNGQSPEHGPIAITGASGGVGMLAISIFSKAGYEVHAISGKPERADFLRELGAREVLPRGALPASSRPMESSRFGGAFDNVGGDTLAALLACTKPYGNVAVCGMLGGIQVPTTVMPFIIRGVSLLGIASSGTPRLQREQVWAHLASNWKPAQLDRIATREIGMDQLLATFPVLLSGASFGRTLVLIAG